MFISRTGPRKFDRDMYVEAGLPNIKGRLSFLPSFGEQAGGLDALYYYAPTQTRMQVAQETANNIPCDPCIDASRSSSLYQDNLTEIKVNALFGLNLIKAF